MRLTEFFIRFNPSQVQFTQALAMLSRSGNLCFNPSQVQFTSFKRSRPFTFFSVSIPHRFNSHIWIFGEQTLQLLRFNPSQVQFIPDVLL